MAHLPPMQAALARQTAVGGRVPLSGLHGHSISNSALLPRSISLVGGTILLVPFTLWAPSAPDVVLDLARVAPQQPIYTITSWKANTGREDVPSHEVLMALNSWRQNLPSHVYMLIVPDVEMRAFHADSFPSGIVISGCSRPLEWRSFQPWCRTNACPHSEGSQKEALAITKSWAVGRDFTAGLGRQFQVIGHTTPEFMRPWLRT